MKIPKKIVEKMEQVNSLMEEVDKWLYENADVDGSQHCYEKYNGEYKHEDWYHFTDKPTGDKQDGGEYCDQHQDGEDSFYGKYYYPTANGKYFMFEFWI